MRDTTIYLYSLVPTDFTAWTSSFEHFIWHSALRFQMERDLKALVEAETQKQQLYINQGQDGIKKIMDVSISLGKSTR